MKNNSICVELSLTIKPIQPSMLILIYLENYYYYYYYSKIKKYI